MGPPLTVDVETIGDRPSGALPVGTPIIQRAIAAAKLMGATPSFSMSSTDSNIPIAMGIPSITVGRGGTGGNAHSLDEWWINESGYRSIQWSLITLLCEAGFVGE
jgi:di/tripeptidase